MTSRYSAILVRSAILLPLGIALTGGLGTLACRALNLPLHSHEMFVAAIACLIPSIGAIIPLYLSRGASQQQVVQTGLLATGVHMLGCLMVAGLLSFVKALGLTNAFEYWTLVFYFITLAIVSSAIIGAINASVPLIASTSGSSVTGGQATRRKTEIH